MVQPATKLKVKVPMIGFSEFSKHGMDYLNHYPTFPPSMAKIMRFMVKFKSMKAASVPFYTRDYITKQNPDSPLKSDKSSTTISVKHIVHKYVRLLKHKISSRK